MNNDENKSCTTCMNLKQEEWPSPFKNITYFCPIIRELTYSTRLINMKLEKLEKFHCCNFKKKK